MGIRKRTIYVGSYMSAVYGSFLCVDVKSGSSVNACIQSGILEKAVSTGNDAQPLRHKRNMQFIAYAAGFAVKMDGASSLRAYMQLAAVQEIQPLKVSMQAPEGCRKHGKYLEPAHIRDDHDIEISVRRAGGGDHFETSALVRLVHDSRTVSSFILKVATVIEINRHCARRIHKYLLQSYDRVSELAKTYSVEKILDRRFESLMAYGRVVANAAADTEAEVGVGDCADIHLHVSPRGKNRAYCILCAHGDIHASGEIIAGTGRNDAERDRAYVVETAEYVMNRAVTADSNDDSMRIMPCDLSGDISCVTFIMGRIDLVGNVSFSQLFYNDRPGISRAF